MANPVCSVRAECVFNQSHMMALSLSRDVSARMCWHCVVPLTYSAACELYVQDNVLVKPPCATQVNVRNTSASSSVIL